MRYFYLFLCAIGLLSFSAVADNYYVDHVAEENWTTSITVYNDGPEDLTFDLQRWDNSGTPLTTLADVSVPANSSTTLTNADFGYYGTAMVVTPESETLIVKLSYRYQDSHSLCEFFIPREHLVSHWMLPNPYQSHFDWFGIALANSTDTTANVTLKAWYNGVVVGTATKAVSPHTKQVDVSSGFWSGINYADVDMVTMDSDVNIPAPLSITGNTEQDRHVFFLGQQEVESDPPATHVYTIPHVAEENWTTAITVYNNKITSAIVTLNTWTAAGDPDAVDHIVAIPAYGKLVLEAGTDFVYRGTGTVSTEDDVQVKLTYRYGESESLCEFFLMENTSTQWFIPNSIHNWFDWFGLAVCNPTDEPIVVALDAYKDGVLQQIGTKLLEPHTKTVGLANDFWPNLSKSKATAYDDVDMVVIRSSVAIPAPLSITGNDEQDRHVFFLSSPDEVDPDFPDPAFKAYVLENFDTDENGTIDTAEADAVYYIDTPGNYSSRGNIRDITGVEIFTNLEQLEVSYEQLSWIPDLSGFPLLSTLKTDSNYLVMMPDWSTLSNLVIINCSSNNLTEIPQLATLVNLNRLYVNFNQLTAIPDLSGLTNLHTLDAGDNDLSELQGTDTLSNMGFFSIYNNNFSTMPDISAMANLSTLNCGKNQLLSVPDFSPFTGIHYLYLNQNQLTSFSGISGMSHLTVLDVSHNDISTLPDLSANTELSSVFIQNTDISAIPGLSSLVDLYAIDCSDSQVTDLSGIATLTNLGQLYCSRCPNIQLPDLSAHDELQLLICRQCNMDDIPDITGCDAIYYFDCAYNNFGSDDCPTIQAIEAMGLAVFDYNPQNDTSSLTCP